jgi:hypothetical protein
MIKKNYLIIIIGLSIGLSSGYLCAFRELEPCMNDFFSSYWWQFYEVLGLPGNIIRNNIWGHGDWQYGEAWCFKHSIAMINGVIWILFFFFIRYYFNLIKDKIYKKM